MYRLAHVRRLLPLVFVLVLAVGCSTSKPGEKTAAPLPSTVQGTVPKEKKATVPAQYKGGDPAAGKKVFLSAGCTGCHTLKDAGSKGTVGPNLGGVASRPTLAGGAVQNNGPDDIKKWILDPPANKPGTQMPKLGLTDDEATRIAAYLVTLR